MAATDKPHRSQKTLDYVFAASCVLLLLGTFWMFVQDYNREYKTVQRDFRDVEEALNEHLMLEKMPARQAIEDRQREVAAARKELRRAQREVEKDEKDFMARHDVAETNYRKIKADYDSRMSHYNIAIEHYGKVCVIGHIPVLAQINRAALLAVYENSFDHRAIS